ncbi:PREDICTED: TP53-regulated inhibitor of apoptosis 1-like isoform X2 [Ceratosolen solmsi marchali]|uniref:TP53-regulated inhibitor of apoptosis 1-like isoform X2 n=1 Tax=Ceratosolen solmsi marchali TaxID=326594 RepID=A0AAJ6YRF6_9HYME|nr:PREDICTED: TP53-regulated inhibitor of apoptosis 1-like isoform X2 [Ceratosolen solmsi marchali]
MDHTKYMKSIDDKCNELKSQYEKCFNAWFSNKFLKGVKNDSMCTSLYNVYQQCLKKAMKEHQIDLHDVEINHLETNKEKIPPS